MENKGDEEHLKQAIIKAAAGSNKSLVSGCRKTL